MKKQLDHTIMSSLNKMIYRNTKYCFRSWDTMMAKLGRQSSHIYISERLKSKFYPTRYWWRSDD